MRQNVPGSNPGMVDNELDIRGLFRTLWKGKFWIVGMAFAFALV
ncbi:MAG TPA: Wzz/FepE/Etk N-terminal domain-containing protein, partial [Buttiauxella sp.]